ncbi:tyrosine-type recombinase/integrase [Streptomyces sp. NPDC058869]|uniref:tyrosine-type recombinase/integrase n=1 Tax=Streptomyces sp. NPDC058869 TaxID=3346659 RepID=UPI0036880972
MNRTAIAPAHESDSSEAAPLRQLIESVEDSFAKLISWDEDLRMISLPQDHPMLGWRQCRVTACEKSAGGPGLCRACLLRFRNQNLSMEEYLKDASPSGRTVGSLACLVPGCDRQWRSRQYPLCWRHDREQQVRGLSVEEYLADPDVRAFSSFGVCQVAACMRSRDGWVTQYCAAHRQQVRLTRVKEPGLDEELWQRVAAPIAENADINLRAVPDLVVWQVLYGLQERTNLNIKTKYGDLRGVINAARRHQVASLEELDPASLGVGYRAIRNSLLRFVNLRLLSPETEVRKVVWNAAAFGLSGTITFADVTQPWLREAAQQWALDDMPRRRGDGVRSVVQSHVSCLARLSKSLRVGRPDNGDSPGLLGRDDIVFFLNRLRLLEEQGEISLVHRIRIIRYARRMLNRMRTLGLARPGGPLASLPHDFALREEDTPDEPEPEERGRDLPAEIMQQLCEALPQLEESSSSLVRFVVEMLIDTGRRPEEITSLAWDCLDRDPDGKPVLIYDNIKRNRPGRRLPIPEPTAELVTRQKQWTRARYPNTPVKDLVLVPTPRSNPMGTRSLSDQNVSEKHRQWVRSLPDLRLADGTEFDKDRVFPYAYRHTYAQRHADAGVHIDALKELMDHIQLDTTQTYYRVGNERRREAVERVAAMQFDHRGNRIWRAAQALLDSEHARRAVGSVSVPYGICTEPTNVAAGGQDCPLRFRCIGCGHFRTDVSYLPDLEAYLADLLRSRERIAAFAAESWAKAEALPSDEEIGRVRRLIKRVRADLGDLTPDEHAQVQEAVAVVRRTRRVVPLGMPKVGPPILDVRPGRSAS